MTKYLIVTADDLGLSKSVNEGIIKAFKEGIVTFLSVIPAGRAFEDASALLAGIKVKEAGAHLSLTETRPITDPGKIPTLIARNGEFYRHKTAFFYNLFTGKINRGEVYLELKNQLQRLKSLGIRLTSLSSHEHIHMMPSILSIFIKLAKEYDIPSIRYPHGDTVVKPAGLNKIYKKLLLSYFEKSVGRALQHSRIIYTDNLAGFLDSGNLTEDILLRILNSLKTGITELVCHPGFLGPEILNEHTFHLNCEAELSALTSRRVKDLIKDQGIRLITYGDMLAGHKA